MFRLGPYFQLDQLSFWLGFLAASLFWWLLGRLRPLWAPIRAALRQRTLAARQELFAAVEIRHRNDVLRRAQGMHIAASLFSLDEILIPPRLLAPAPPPGPDIPALLEDITDGVLPYLVDWPELAAIYHAPHLTLAQALQNKARLVLVGQPGSGRSVALASLAIQVARRDPGLGNLTGSVPLLVHAAELFSDATAYSDPLEPLFQATAFHASTLTLPRLPNFLKAALEEGRGLLLLDGLDEILPAERGRVVQYLSDLLHQYPASRAMIASSPDHMEDLAALNFQPVALMPWDESLRLAFIQKWNGLWQRFIAQPAAAGGQSTDPALLVGWLYTGEHMLTPLELTLKVWAAYAGDILGAGPVDALEAFLRRMAATRPESLGLLKRMAEHLAKGQESSLPREADSWASESETGEVQTGWAHSAAGQAPLASRSLPALIDSGLLIQLPNNQLVILHPVLAGYLASLALLTSKYDPGTLPGGWYLTGQTQRFLSAMQPAPTWIQPILASGDKDPLKRGLFQVARWLPIAPENANWRSFVLRQLASMLQNDSLPISQRARALAALVLSSSSGVGSLLRQALSSHFPTLRQLAALGAGVIRDTKSFNDLSLLLADQTPAVRRAACLALVAIADQRSLETVASSLLHGDEELRRSAAEALANNPDEGHPTLIEGSTIDDLLIRRAVVFGLLRVGQIWPEKDWVIPTLEKIHQEDKQWVVQNAAEQALETLRRPNPRIPSPRPVLTETPWLIAFAGERGIGVAPGKPALDLVILALREGNPEQKLAAMDTLAFSGGEAAIRPAYQAYFSDRSDLQGVAYETLLRLVADGMPLPPPAKFGF